MKFDRQIIRLIVVAVVAYGAGRIGFVAGAGSSVAAPAQPERASARDLNAPGRHHRHLDRLIGDWTLEFSVRSDAVAEPVVFKGSVTREWVLGGRFVKEIMDLDDDAHETSGVGYIGYNNLDGRYEIVWMDATSTGITFETGMYHPDDKVLHWRGEVHDPDTGRLINSWGKLNMSDPDRHVYTGYSVDVEGRTFRAVEGVTKRIEGRR